MANNQLKVPEDNSEINIEESNLKKVLRFCKIDVRIGTFFITVIGIFLLFFISIFLSIETKDYTTAILSVIIFILICISLFKQIKAIIAYILEN